MRIEKRFRRSGSQPKCEPLTSSEVDWIATQIRVANLHLALLDEDLQSLAPGSPEATALMESWQRNGLPPLGLLDDLVEDWLGQPENQRPDANTIVNAVGVCVGQHIADRTGLTWVIATDRHGSELALAGSIANVLIYPQNLVAKRIVAGEVGFVESLVSLIVQEVTSVLKIAAP